MRCLAVLRSCDPLVTHANIPFMDAITSKSGRWRDLRRSFNFNPLIESRKIYLPDNVLRLAGTQRPINADSVDEFVPSPDPDPCWHLAAGLGIGGHRARRLEELAALGRGEAVVLLGPPGAGKTLLLQDLAQALSRAERCVIRQLAQALEEQGCTVEQWRIILRLADGGPHPMSEIADKVKKIVVEHLGVEESKVTPEASFIDDLGADSLDTVELVMAFEEAFNVEIPEDAAEKISTVKDAIDYIEKQKAV